MGENRELKGSSLTLEEVGHPELCITEYGIYFLFKMRAAAVFPV